MIKIIIVEDDVKLNNLIKTVLERKEWQKKEEYGDLYDDTNKLF